MPSILEQIRIIEKGSNKSKVKFQWDFHKELEKLLKKVEEAVTNQIIPNYWVIYTEYGTHWTKLKIKDDDLMVEKLIVCNFTFHKNDEKFWYVEPEFIVTEKSQKTKMYNIWKFSIRKTDDIIKAFVLKLIDCIEEF